MLKNLSRYLLMVFVAFFVIAGLFSIYLNPVGEKPTIAIGELVKKLNGEKKKNDEKKGEKKQNNQQIT